MARAAHEVAGDWSFAGGTVVSGLARGIDGQAHRGVLEGPRRHAQVAVMPCALDQVFPRIHEPLARRIEEAGGLLVSEQPPGRQVERWMFAARNRMVTGLSAATVVVQSPARGGSLISAKCAHDQDRELYTFHQPQWGVRWAGNRALVVDDMAMPVPDVDALWQAMADHTPWVAKRRDHGIRLPVGCVVVWGQVDAVHPRTERALASAVQAAASGRAAPAVHAGVSGLGSSASGPSIPASVTGVLEVASANSPPSTSASGSNSATGWMPLPCWMSAAVITRAVVKMTTRRTPWSNPGNTSSLYCDSMAKNNRTVINPRGAMYSRGDMGFWRSTKRNTSRTR